MGKWKVKLSWAAGSRPVRGVDHAYSFVLTSSDGRQTKTTVEFDNDGRGGSAREAHQALAPYLDEDDPPSLLVVDRAGKVHPGNGSEQL